MPLERSSIWLEALPPTPHIRHHHGGVGRSVGLFGVDPILETPALSFVEWVIPGVESWVIRLK